MFYNLSSWETLFLFRLSSQPSSTSTQRPTSVLPNRDLCRACNVRKTLTAKCVEYGNECSDCDCMKKRGISRACSLGPRAANIARGLYKKEAHIETHIYIYMSRKLSYEYVVLLFILNLCHTILSVSFGQRQRPPVFRVHEELQCPDASIKHTHTICPPRWQIAATAISFAGSSSKSPKWCDIWMSLSTAIHVDTNYWNYTHYSRYLLRQMVLCKLSFIVTYVILSSTNNCICINQYLYSS